MKDQISKARLAEECEKMDKEFERELAEEMLTEEHFAVSFYVGKVSK